MMMSFTLNISASFEVSHWDSASIMDAMSMHASYAHGSEYGVLLTTVLVSVVLHVIISCCFKLYIQNMPEVEHEDHTWDTHPGFVWQWDDGWQDWIQVPESDDPIMM